MSAVTPALLREAEVPKVPFGRQYGNSTGISSLLGFIVCFGAILFVLFAAVEVSKRQLPFVNYLILTIVFGVMLVVPIVVSRLFVHSARAAMKSSNWVARLTDDGIYLNFRSWLNWRLDGSAKTAVFIPCAEIERIYEVRETVYLTFKVTPDLTYHAFAVIKVRGSCSLAGLDRAIREEILTTMKDTANLSGAWSEVPVFVNGEDEIWIALRTMSLLRALAKRHIIRGERKSLDTVIGEGLTPEDLDRSAPILRWAIYHGLLNGAHQIAQFKLKLGSERSAEFIAGLLTGGLKS